MSDSEQKSGKGLWVGLGAGLVGAAVLALRMFIRPPTKTSIPEAISPPTFSTQAFQSGRGQMIYHEGGAGPEPTIIFVHDLRVGASSYEWAGVYASFVGARRVLAPDLVGFGESERPSGHFSAADGAASLAEFAEMLCAEETQRPVVVASGLGAGLAALAAAQNPALFSRLLFWMPVGSAETSWKLNLASRLPTIKNFVYRNQLARRASIGRRFAQRSGGETMPSEALEVYALCAQQYQADCGVNRLLQRRLDLDLAATLRKIQAPVTLFWPERAPSGALGSARKLAAESRLGALRIVPGTNACAPILTPHLVAAALNDDLQGDLRVLREAV